MSAILVTGGCGFIGSALVRQLIGLGHTVVNADALTYSAVPEALRDVEDSSNYRHVVSRIESRDAINRLMLNVQPDVVFHLAAETHVDRSIDDPHQFLLTNVLGTASLLEAAETMLRTTAKPRDGFRFVHVSTDEVYGSADLAPFSASTPYAPRSPYSASKAASDHLARAWFHTYGLPTIVTNCSNNYGPWQFPEKLIPRMITRALTGRSMPVYGDGLHERDWLHVDDHVAGLLSVMEKGEPGGTYLFGTGVATQNRELVGWIADALDEVKTESPRTHHELIEFVTDRPGHDRRYVIDPMQTMSALNWTPSIDIESGLRSTVRWFVEHRDWWEHVLNTRYDTSRLGTR